jgi:16S rRNA A1518/A1519 N6-dimethyltransferase RsmA/KsgA/DIM1 with predicted DNA glycosylase/AP lyase activity
MEIFNKKNKNENKNLILDNNLNLDQHFLNSKNTLNLIAKLSKIEKNDIVLEIGGGDGRLSEILIKNDPKKLIISEIDSRYFKILNEKFKDNEKVVILNENGLDVLKNQNISKVVSNIPYAITEKLYELILDKKIETVLLLHGINFYNVINDKKSKWSYFVPAFYDLELIKEIPGTAFIPKTKTMSVLVELKLKKDDDNEDKFNFFLKKLYERKDRNIKNALIFSLVEIGFEKKKAKNLISDLILNLNLKNLEAKFRQINNNEFLSIISYIKKKLNGN